MLGSSLFSPPPPPPDPAQRLKGYAWPASALISADMQKLCELREKTGQPITKLIREAIAAYHELLTRR